MPSLAWRPAGGGGSAWRLAGLWLGASALALGVSLYVGGHPYLPLRGWWDGVPVSQLLPCTWLIRIPGLAAFRDAARLALLGLSGAALLAGSAVEWLRRITGTRRLTAIRAIRTRAAPCERRGTC